MENSTPAVKKGRKKDPRDVAMDLFETMGVMYHNIFQAKGQTQAYRYFLLELRKNQRILVDGGIYTAKELDDRVDDLQGYLKSSGDDGTASMEDIFHRWLNEESVGAVQ